MNSLRLRLLVTIFCTMLLAWIAVVWVAYDKGRHEAEELMDGQLSLTARLLEAQVQRQPEYEFTHTAGNRSSEVRANNASLVEVLDAESRKPYEQELAFKIWDDQQTLILRSANAEFMQYSSHPGYSDSAFGDALWRMYVKSSADNKRHIQVAHPVQSRDSIGLDIVTQITIPLFLAFPFLLLTLFLAIQRSLRPLKSLAVEVRQRKVDELDDISVNEVPTELKPFIDAFNQLLERVRTSIVNERRFTADAAHELRTPLAGIKIHAQLISICPDDASRGIAVAQVMRGINRAEQLVEQMLKLARLDPEHDVLKSGDRVDVTNMLLEAQDAVSVLARSKDQTIILDRVAGNLNMPGDQDLLLTALRNLATNSCRYSPPATQIIIGCKQTSDAVVLYVSDQGPGIAEQELPHITQRFRRGNDVLEEGSGLGLTIVERIASLHGAVLKLTNQPNGGLLAELIFSN